jgi:plastocyanin
MNKYCLLIITVVCLLILRTAPEAQAVSESAGDSEVMVSIEGSAFSPEVVTVKAGTVVVWKNKDAAPHTITADNGSFDSGTLSQGAEFRKKFDTPGIFRYSCDVHAYMSGRVEVK